MATKRGKGEVTMSINQFALEVNAEEHRGRRMALAERQRRLALVRRPPSPLARARLLIAAARVRASHASRRQAPLNPEACVECV